ncbi:hypothetical protein WMY93_019222 [Mugilogobius chulae]|uniref:Uncharacterized protein n=1 Tax=Mugilogobius chulae TaxID=88201 RepID=A0AAW0NQS5_9GOBI
MEHVNKMPSVYQWREHNASTRKPYSKPPIRSSCSKRPPRTAPVSVTNAKLGKNNTAGRQTMDEIISAMERLTISGDARIKMNSVYWSVPNCSETAIVQQHNLILQALIQKGFFKKRHNRRENNRNRKKINAKKAWKKDLVNQYKRQPVNHQKVQKKQGKPQEMVIRVQVENAQESMIRIQPTKRTTDRGSYQCNYQDDVQKCTKRRRNRRRNKGSFEDNSLRKKEKKEMYQTGYKQNQSKRGWKFTKKDSNQMRSFMTNY